MRLNKNRDRHLALRFSCCWGTYTPYWSAWFKSMQLFFPLIPILGGSMMAQVLRFLPLGWVGDPDWVFGLWVWPGQDLALVDMWEVHRVEDFSQYLCHSNKMNINKNWTKTGIFGGKKILNPIHEKCFFGKCAFWKKLCMDFKTVYNKINVLFNSEFYNFFWNPLVLDPSNL